MPDEFVTVNGFLYKLVGPAHGEDRRGVMRPHDEKTCHWHKDPMRRQWRCEHDVVFTGIHPTGYCDAGCCR